MCRDDRKGFHSGGQIGSESSPKVPSHRLAAAPAGQSSTPTSGDSSPRPNPLTAPGAPRGTRQSLRHHDRPGERRRARRLIVHGESDDQPELYSFAVGIRRRGRVAVTAGLTLPCSSKVDGNVNRIEAIQEPDVRAARRSTASANEFSWPGLNEAHSEAPDHETRTEPEVPSAGVLSARRLRWSTTFGRRFSVSIIVNRHWRVDALTGEKARKRRAARQMLVDCSHRMTSRR